MGLKFVHAADLHLDTPFRGIHGAAPWLADALREASLGTFDRICGLAIQEAVDFVILAGDVYDLRDHSLAAELRLYKGFQRLREAGIRVYMAHGNHDPLTPAKRPMRWPDNVVVFPPGAVAVAVHRQAGRPVAELHGMSFPATEVHDNWVPQFVRRHDAPYAIAVLHTNVDGTPGHDNYAPARLSEMVASGFDYWALGHVHTHRVLARRPWVVYPGNPQGRHINESGPKGVVMVTVGDGGDTRVEFVPIHVVEWRGISVDAAGARDETGLLDILDSALAGLAHDRPLVVRITVKNPAKPLADSLLETETARELLASLEPRGPGAGDWVWIESIVSEPFLGTASWGSETFVGEFLRQLDWAADRPDVLRQWLSPLAAKPAARRYVGIDARRLEDIVQKARGLGLGLLTGREGEGAGED